MPQLNNGARAEGHISTVDESEKKQNNED